MTKKLLRPEQVKDWLIRRYNNQHRGWLEGGGDWPLRVPFGTPTESDVASDLSAVRAWVDSWLPWPGVGVVETEERRWARLGSQTLPVALSLHTAREVAIWCGQERRWLRAGARLEQVLQRWPALRGAGSMGKYFDVLADYSDIDVDRLLAVVSWLLENPTSGLYVRQLPILGVDTKWLEKRTGLVTEFLGLLRASPVKNEFFEATGLKRLPQRIRMRILCPELRMRVGGLSDIEATVEDLVALELRPSSVLMVENLASGVSLPGIAGAVAFIGLGNAVSLLAQLKWVQGLPAVYWGDLDTHGIAILARARRVFPGVRSILMDEATLEQFKELTVQEPTQCLEADLESLTEAEGTVFLGLKSGTWGARLRLEQERIPWPIAEAEIRSALACRHTDT